MNLSECRNEIDKIDKELVELFEKRMNVAINVAKYKIENNIPIFNGAREAEVIEKNINRLNNKEYSKLTEKFFTHLMELSRSLQADIIDKNNKKNNNIIGSIEENISTNENKRDLKNIKIGYQGVKGSFSEEAMIKYFGENHTTTDYEEFEDVFVALKNNEVKKIILTRPAVEAGENLGFLPGDLKEKVDPYLRPLYDALYDMLGVEQTEKLMEKGVIEIAPLAYMRGRTLEDAYVILDEAQNTTDNQMKMFLTRLGFRSKMIVTGDISQIDLPRNTTSGLIRALDILEGVKGISFIHLSAMDVVRHPVVQRIIERYDGNNE